MQDTINSKNEFIIYLQDEINWLRSIMKEEKFERVRDETDFKSSRGYKSNYIRIREQVLANKSKSVVFVKEEDFDSKEIE